MTYRTNIRGVESLSFENSKVGAMSGLMLCMFHERKSGITVPMTLEEAEEKFSWKAEFETAKVRAWIRSAATKMRVAGIIQKDSEPGIYEVTELGKEWAETFYHQDCMIRMPQSKRRIREILDNYANGPVVEPPKPEVETKAEQEPERPEKTSSLPPGIQVKYETKDGNAFGSVEEAVKRTEELTELEELMVTWVRVVSDTESGRVPLERVIDAILDEEKWAEVKDVRP